MELRGVKHTWLGIGLVNEWLKQSWAFLFVSLLRYVTWKDSKNGMLIYVPYNNINNNKYKYTNNGIETNKMWFEMVLILYYRNLLKSPYLVQMRLIPKKLLTRHIRKKEYI